MREINERFGTADWRPIHLVKQSLPVDRLAIVYRLVDVHRQLPAGRVSF